MSSSYTQDVSNSSPGDYSREVVTQVHQEVLGVEREVEVAGVEQEGRQLWVEADKLEE